MNLERYSRLQILPAIGQNGQKALFKAKVGIFGLGGLGSWSSLLLTQMGVGHLRIIDRDVVELSNLARTPIYNQESIDLPKAEQAAIFLRKVNPDVIVEEITANIDSNSIEALVKGLDIVIDGLDNVTSRLIINRECQKRKIPFVFAGAIGTSANLSTFSYKEGDPCLNCLFQAINDDDLEKCDVLGVHSALLSMVASIQVAEAIKLLTQKQAALESKLCFVNFDSLEFDFIPLKKRANCSVCYPVQDKKKVSERKIIELCGDKTFLIPKNSQEQINLTNLANQLNENQLKIIKQGSLGLTFEYFTNEQSKVIISIFSNGNMLIRGESDQEKIKQLSHSLFIKFKIEQAD